MAITLLVLGCLETIKKEHSTSSNVQHLVRDGVLYFKGRIYLDEESPLLKAIIEQFHSSTHECLHKTLHRIRAMLLLQGIEEKG